MPVFPFWFCACMKKIIDYVLQSHWAIIPEQLELIAQIAQREHDYANNLDALASKLGRPLGNTMTASVRDGVAIVPIEGALFRHANLMTQFSGATSYDTLATDFRAAIEDPTVHSIILQVDSPGGQVNGGSELAQQIRAASTDSGKPVVAYIGGTGASAAYWLASAASKIFAADTAIIGSIGAQAGYRIDKPENGTKEIRFVSSQSPLKNPNPETEAFAKQQQSIVDGLAQVFIETVAAYRGTTTANVLENYGQGAVFVATEAQKRGMIDGLTTLEELITSLQKESTKMDYKDLTPELVAQNAPDVFKAIQATIVVPDVEAANNAGRVAERERIQAIIEAGNGVHGAESIINAAIADASKTPEAFAMDLLKHMKANASAFSAPPIADPAKTHLSNMESTEASMTPPTPSGDTSASVSEMDKAKAEIEEMRKQGIIR